MACVRSLRKRRRPLSGDPKHSRIKRCFPLCQAHIEFMFCVLTTSYISPWEHFLVLELTVQLSTTAVFVCPSVTPATGGQDIVMVAPCTSKPEVHKPPSFPKAHG